MHYTTSCFLFTSELNNLTVNRITHYSMNKNRAVLQKWQSQEKVCTTALLFCSFVLCHHVVLHKCSTCKHGPSPTVIFFGGGGTGKRSHLWREKVNGQSEHVSWVINVPSQSKLCLLFRLMLDFGRRSLILSFCPWFTEYHDPAVVFVLERISG